MKPFSLNTTATRTPPARECVKWGPEKWDGRMVPVRCIDRRCFIAAVCRLDDDQKINDGSPRMPLTSTQESGR